MRWAVAHEEGLLGRVQVAIALAVVLTVVAAGCGPASEGEADAGSAVSMGIAVKNDLANAPLVLAEERGIYERYGLQVELVYFDGGGAMVQAMAGGQVDYGWVSHTPVIKAASEGAAIRIIAEVSKTPIGWGLMVSPDSPIRTPEDLEPGMKISYTSEGALSNWLALYEAQLAGVAADELQGVPIGTSLPTIRTALENGQVDAATVLMPWGYELADEGAARWVAHMPEQLSGFSYTGINATDEALRDERTSACLVGAYTETVGWMRDNPEETEQWFESNYDVDADLARRAYEELVPDFNDSGALAVDRLQETIETIQQVSGFLSGSPQAEDVLQQVAPASEGECAS